jgi:hypothetical protein
MDSATRGFCRDPFAAAAGGVVHRSDDAVTSGACIGAAGILIFRLPPTGGTHPVGCLLHRAWEAEAAPRATVDLTLTVR